ncbi:hypothetical protein B0J17DRAFT_772603 [Rhizoctonia solani]|nr:hypothetical protein B0J17DRAFT_772603 [Rhizoctonia solani]
MANMRLKRKRVPKKSLTSSKAASSLRKITLKIPKPVPHAKTQSSTQPQAMASFEDEVDELEGDMDLYVTPGSGDGIGDSEDDDEDVLEESEEQIEIEEEEQEQGEEEEEEEEEELVKEQKQEEDRNFDMPFHVPLGVGKGVEFKILDLCGSNNFQYFQIRVANTVKVDQAVQTNLHISYCFSNAKSNNPYHVLESRSDWERLVKEFGQRWKRVWKGSSPLSIWIKVKMDGVDEAKKPAKHTQKGKGQKLKSKLLLEDSDESEDQDDGNWRIL